MWTTTGRIGEGSMSRHLVRGLIIVTALSIAALASAAPFRNVTNQRFRSRTNGPQGAIVVTDPGSAAASAAAINKGRGRARGTVSPAAVVSPVAARSTVSSAIAAQHGTAQLQHAVRTLKWMQAHGLRSPKAQLRFPRAVVHADAAGNLVLPDLVQVRDVGGTIGASGNQLTFDYSGWDTDEQAMLAAYLATAYPKARMVYGPPAFSANVTIIKDATVTALQGGVYDVTRNEIHLAPLSGNQDEDTFVLLLLVLQAFHGNASFFYDAWEQGFAGAAATAIQLSVAPNFSPAMPGPFYCLSVYEAENQPELGNSTFYPASGFTGMLVWRIAMARAAWLKCWIEDPNFFVNFNQAYYAQFADTLPGDAPALTDIGAQVLPTVEGLPFAVWYQKQYVLDTSVSVGSKLYTWNIPLTESVALITESYFTDTTASESARGGTVRTDYLNWDFSVSLYAEEGNLIQIPASGDGAGEGFLIPTFFNIGGTQRITVQVELNDVVHQYPFPYEQRGFESGENNFYGAIINNTTGTVTTTGGSVAVNATVANGAWGGRVTAADLNPAKIHVTYARTDGQQVTRQVNVGWDSYVVFLDGGGQSTVHVGLLANQLYMMSLPLTPLTDDAAATLGVSSNDMLMARYDPRATGTQLYRMWPQCDPFAPGRGYWLRLATAVDKDVAGVLPATGAEYRVPLNLGWNQIGIPRMGAVAVSDLKVAVGTQPEVSFNDAVTQKLVQNGLFNYDPLAGYQLQTSLLPLQGYWIRCLNAQGAQLVFPATTGVSAAKVAAKSVKASATVRPSATSATSSPKAVTTSGRRSDSGGLGALAWKLPLRATAGNYTCSTAYVGAAQDATDGPDATYDIAGPPALGNYVQVRFPHSDWGAQGGDYVCDVRAAVQKQQTWRMRVESTVADAPVTLSWPDLTGVPSGLRPVLVDEDSGRRTYMRTTQSVTIAAAAGQSAARSFRIELLPAAQTPTPQVVSLMASRTGAGVGIVYTLTADAQVSARMLNIAGRPVRSLVSDRAQPAGQNSLVWNLRSDQDCVVPGGMYLLEMSLATPEGQATKMVRSVMVGR